jgi:WD40 repeat protein
VPGGGSGILWLTDNKVHLWDAATGKKLRQIVATGPAPKNRGLPLHPNAFSSIRFAPGGTALLTVGQDRTIRFWDVREGKELRRWETTWVTSLAFSPDGKLLATGGVDCAVRLWDAMTGQEVRQQPGHYGGVRFLALSPDGRRIASATLDQSIHIWDATPGRELHRLRGPEGEMAPVAFSADSRTLTTVGLEFTLGGGDKKGRVWDVVSGKELRHSPELHDCSAFAVSADGRTYAFIGKNKPVGLWDAVAERKLAVRIEHPKGITQVAFSTDARTLFGWCGDHKVHIWEVTTGKELRQFAAGDGGDWNSIAVSPDGRWLAWVGRDREFRLYDLSTGEEARRITANSHFISCLAFAPDGRTLARSSMYDPVIYLWETASGQVRHRLTGHKGRIFTLVFSADGKRLLSGSEDTTALLWDLIGDHAGRGRAGSPSIRSNWDALASEDAETAYQALRSLAATGGPAVDFLGKQLQPIPEPDPKRVAQLIADLDHESFARREQATKELENEGESVERALRAAIAQAKSAEVRRRVEALLAKLPESQRRAPSPARLQMLRAIEVLEYFGTAEARELLRRLAGGAAGARQTREAKAALKRLTSRSSAGG